MDKKETLQLIYASNEIPTFPPVALKLISLTSQENSSTDEIADIISKDISLTSKILKVSNSSFYNFPKQISSIKQAVSLLGTNSVRSIALSFSFFNLKTYSNESEFNYELFWEKSLASAVSAKLIIDKINGNEFEEVFISALLQNIGELISATIFPSKYKEVLSIWHESCQELSAIEEQHFGISYAEIGFEIAKGWGLPEILLHPILYHHKPETYTGKDAKIKQHIEVVSLSDLVTNILYSEKPKYFHDKFQEKAKRLLKLTNKDIESILEEVHIQIEEVSTYFDLRVTKAKPIQDILQEANVRLSLLNLNYEQMNKELIQAKIELEKIKSELEEKNTILADQASHDGLTGLYNHRHFQTVLDKKINQFTRNRSLLTLILIDIDHFKQFNDKHGHLTGDFILKEFSDVLKSNIRNYDTVARYGGEEFIIILPETTLEDGKAYAEKMRALIEAKVFKDKKKTYRVTASFGVATSAPAIEGDFSKTSFIQKADQSLYLAKQKGRNRVEINAPKKKWYSFS